MRSLPNYSMARSIAAQKGYDEKLGCCICGATNTTLYKNGKNRICKQCRKQKLQETGGNV